MIRKLVEENRTFRKFDPLRKVTYQEFIELVEVARLCPSSTNNQTLRFAFADKEKSDIIFNNIKWAILIKDGTPSPKQRPTAYVLVLNDNDYGKPDYTSAGIAIQSMLLRAVEMGLRGCIFGSVDRENLHRSLALGKSTEILNVIALGKPAETVVIDDINIVHSTNYWRDENGVHHVPKIIAEDLIIKL